MSWLSGPVPHADPTHPHVRWGCDLNEFHPLGAEHWAWIVDNAHTANEYGSSVLERVIFRATSGTKVDTEFVRGVRMARGAQAELVRRGLPAFSLGAYMLLRPPGLIVGTVTQQVRAFAKASLILGADRREFAAVDVEGHALWRGKDAAGAARDALKGVQARLCTRPWVYSYPSFWRDFRLAPECRAIADLWAAQYNRTDWADTDRVCGGTRVDAWQFGGGPLGGRPGWPPISKTVLRS